MKDFYKKCLSSFGYNLGNSVPVETLIDEILPEIFSKQKEMLCSEKEVEKLVRDFIFENQFNYTGNLSQKEHFTQWFKTHKKQ